jgi:hypothetical protein
MSVTELIMEGDADDSLDEIMDAVRQRKHTLSRIFFAELTDGDKVRVINTRPKYLNGAIGTVEGKKNRVTRVPVRFPSDMGDHDPYDKWAGKIGIMDPSQVERVDDGG